MNELTIADLEELLADARASGANDDTPVHFSYAYGDRWATQVAPAASVAEMLHVKHSRYHQMDVLTEDDGQEQSDRAVLVIS